MRDVEELVVRAQLGDCQAYDCIVQRFQDMAFSYAYSILGDYDLAEDAKQEAFISAYCDLLTLREPASFPAWFRTIIHRQSVNIIRGRQTLLVPLDYVPGIAANELAQPSQFVVCGGRKFPVFSKNFF